MFCFCLAFIVMTIFSEQQQKMSKYCVSDTCQNNELNSLSHRSCYLLALVADYDGSTLVSEIILMLLMAIITTLTTTGMSINPKTSGGFFLLCGCTRQPRNMEYLTVINVLCTGAASIHITFDY